jgi:hypothetical protein
VADRLPIGEEAGGPPGYELGGNPEGDHGIRGTLREAETLSWFVLPRWMHLPQIANAVAVLLGVVWLGVEGAIFGWRRFGGRTVRELRG